MIFHVRSLPVRALVRWMSQPLPPGPTRNGDASQAEFFRRRKLATRILTRRVGAVRPKRYEWVSPNVRCQEFLMRWTPTVAERRRAAVLRVCATNSGRHAQQELPMGFLEATR